MYQKFTVFPRKLKRGTVYNVRLREEDGKRLPARSSGQTKKGTAMNWANKQIKSGKLPSRIRTSEPLSKIG